MRDRPAGSCAVFPGLRGDAIVGSYGVGSRLDVMQQFRHRDVEPGAIDLVGVAIHAFKGGGWYTPSQWITYQGGNPNVMNDKAWSQLWDKSGAK